MYTSSYTRKRGKFYHLVFEYIKNKKKTVKSKSSKTDNEELAEEMLKVFEEECRKFFGISEDKKVGSRKSVFTKVDQDVNLFDKEISFCNFILGYVKMRFKTIDDATYSSYLSNTKISILPYFFKENKKLKDINTFDIQKYYFHELNVRGVSANTVIHYHNLLSLTFKYAQKIGIITINPMLNVEKPKKVRYIAKVYNHEQIKEMLEILKKEDKALYLGVVITSFFGLRRSELLGLKWSAINFVDNTMSIVHTVTETNLDGKNILIKKDKTKSTAGLRSFVLPGSIKEMLLELKEEQKRNKERLSKGYYTKDEEYVYVNEGGELHKPKFLTNGFRKFLAKHNLTHIRFHDLRHSCATILCESNVNVKDIQMFLGHSSAKTTMDIYVHQMNKSNLSTVSIINEKIGI